MTRPRKSEHIREQLLQKGIELFSEYGYHGTGLKKILDTLNVPKGSFYNYFESKENFAAEIIDTYSQELLKRLDHFLETTDEDPVTVIQTVYRIMVQELEEQGFQKGCLLGNLAAEIGGASESIQASMQRAIYSWRKRFVGLVLDAQNQNLIRDDLTAEQLTDIFWNHWEGGLLRMKIDGNSNKVTDSIDALLNVLFK